MAVGGGDHRDFRAEFEDLGGEKFDIVAGRESIHLIQVAIAPHHVEGVGADRACRAENGERSHDAASAIYHDNRASARQVADGQ